MNINRHQLTTIYFYLSKGCNLRCYHCWIAPEYQAQGSNLPSLDFDLFKKIICQALPLGLKNVKLTGGEPLLHPQINDILDWLNEQGLKIILETNGVLCTPEIAAKVALRKGSFVSVSLDGSDARTHEKIRGVAGCYEPTIQGIKNLVKVGLNVQIIMSIMKSNKSQMADVVRLAESLGAKSVKFNIVQPIARGEIVHQSDRMLSIKELVELGKWVESELWERTKLSIFHSHPLAFRPLKNIFADFWHQSSVCRIFNILGVLSDGSYALCGIGETVPELIFGNAKNRPLEEVWNNTEVLQQLRQNVPENLQGICRRCVMNKSCLGHCIAQNFYRNKDLLSAYWYCEEADKLGLFPESRKLRY